MEEKQIISKVKKIIWKRHFEGKRIELIEDFIEETVKETLKLKKHIKG